MIATTSRPLVLEPRRIRAPSDPANPCPSRYCDEPRVGPHLSGSLVKESAAGTLAGARARCHCYASRLAPMDRSGCAGQAARMNWSSSGTYHAK